ncbi:MAG: GNAT family N-acetyltransferase [Pseudomonadota bacterium]
MGSETLTLRTVSEDDFAPWAALWRGYLEFYGMVLPAEVYRTSFQRLLSPDPYSFQGLLAERAGQAVGLAHFLFHPHMWRPEGVCYLQDLFATPEARGTGVGRALIEAVYAAADRRGSPRVYWLTQTSNETARLLYDRVGTQADFIRYDRRAG